MESRLQEQIFTHPNMYTQIHIQTHILVKEESQE